MAKILIVEDDTLVAMAICDALQEAGHYVVHAHSGDAALARLEREFPDLVITDYRMPRMDGGELIRFIRNSEEFLSVPILLLSSYSPAVAGVSGLIQGHLAEPYSQGALMTAVRQVLEDAGIHAGSEEQLKIGG